MRKAGRLKRALLTALCAAAALLLFAAGLSRAIYGRSLAASVYEVWLRRRYATDRTPEAERARLEAKRAGGEAPAALPKRVRFRTDVREADFNGLQVFTLNAGADGARVLYLHGGAYINGFNAHQWRFMDRLAADADCAVVAPAYHLAPFADYRRAYADLTALYRAMIDESPDRLILMGDSAGGGLALGLAQALVAANDPLPERLILFSPWVDVSMDNPDIEPLVPVDPILHLGLVKVHGEYWAGAGDVHDWHVSPVYGDMAGLPPVTIYCGTREMLYPDIEKARDRLLDAGVEVEFNVGRGLNHDYPLMPLPEAEAAVREVIAAVRTPPGTD